MKTPSALASFAYFHPNVQALTEVVHTKDLAALERAIDGVVREVITHAEEFHLQSSCSASFSCKYFTLRLAIPFTMNTIVTMIKHQDLGNEPIPLFSRTGKSKTYNVQCVRRGLAIVTPLTAFISAKIHKKAMESTKHPGATAAYKARIRGWTNQLDADMANFRDSSLDMMLVGEEMFVVSDNTIYLHRPVVLPAHGTFLVQKDWETLPTAVRQMAEETRDESLMTMKMKPGLEKATLSLLKTHLADIGFGAFMADSTPWMAILPAATVTYTMTKALESYLTTESQMAAFVIDHYARAFYSPYALDPTAYFEISKSYFSSLLKIGFRGEIAVAEQFSSIDEVVGSIISHGHYQQATVDRALAFLRFRQGRWSMKVGDPTGGTPADRRLLQAKLVAIASTLPPYWPTDVIPSKWADDIGTVVKGECSCTLTYDGPKWLRPQLDALWSQTPINLQSADIVEAFSQLSELHYALLTVEDLAKIWRVGDPSFTLSTSTSRVVEQLHLCLTAPGVGLVVAS